MKEKVLLGDKSDKAQGQYLALKALSNSSPYNRKQVSAPRSGFTSRDSAPICCSLRSQQPLCILLTVLPANILIFYSSFSSELDRLPHQQTCFPKSLAMRTAASFKPISASPCLPFGYIKLRLPPKILLQENPIACCSEEGDIALNAGLVQQGHPLPKASYESKMALSISTIGLS